MEGTPTTRGRDRRGAARLHVNPFYVGTVVAADDSAAAIIANFKLTPEMPGYPEIQDRLAEVARRRRTTAPSTSTSAAPSRSMPGSRASPSGR